MENLALFLHLTGAFLFVAGIALAGVGFESARRRERPAEIALLLGLTRWGMLAVALGAVLLLGCGLWLVGLEDVDLGTGWVSAALALFIAVVVLGTAGGQRPKRARKLATALAESGQPASAELRRLLDDPLSGVLNYASAALVLAILALMVFKP